MRTKDEYKLGGDGHSDPEALEETTEESEEQIQTALKHLNELKRPDGALTTLGKQELSLLQKVLSTATEAYREEQMWRMCDFVDDEEALDHVAAYYEARELGMDTSFNVAYMFALCSANRKGAFTSNLIANIVDAVQKGKWARASSGKAKHDGTSPRSPLAS